MFLINLFFLWTDFDLIVMYILCEILFNETLQT